MSRTNRRIPHNRWLRRPKGRKQALIRGSRPKGVPPDAWDDIPIAGRDEDKKKKRK